MKVTFLEYRARPLLSLHHFAVTISVIALLFQVNLSTGFAPHSILLPKTAAEVLLKLPLAFEQVAGINVGRALFQARGLDGILTFQQDSVHLALHDNAAIDLQYMNANPAVYLLGQTQSAGVTNYMLGQDSAQWQLDHPLYTQITYKQLYPGIDLIYDGTSNSLKGTYIVAPGADPTTIHWRYRGASQVEPQNGDLIIDGLRDQAPIAWQGDGSHRIPVSIRYVVNNDGVIGFAIGPHDSSRSLVIDPVLSYASVFGGTSGYTDAYGIALDKDGNVYVAGQTGAPDFPTHAAYQAQKAGTQSVFVTKINAAGTAIIYSTFLGGADNPVKGNLGTIGTAIAVDSTGSAIITGTTDSPSFPLQAPTQATSGGLGDVFVTKLSPNGDSLIYSTYLGGEKDDIAHSITLDNADNAYIAGETNSSGFPVKNGFQVSSDGVQSGFISRINSKGGLDFSTFLGGSGSVIRAITLDKDGNIAVTGTTESKNFPVKNPYQQTLAGVSNAFIAKLDGSGKTLLYSTYFGGDSRDIGVAITIAADGSIYVSGITQSPKFPTKNAMITLYGGGTQSFLAKFDAAGDKLIYSTFWPGLSRAITIDKDGNVYITGDTSSSLLPLKDPIKAAPDGDDAYVSELNPTGDAMIFSTFLGGSDLDASSAIALDPAGNIYIAGNTESTNFPVKNPLPESHQNLHSSFVAKISTGSEQSTTATETPVATVSNTDNTENIVLSVSADSSLALINDPVTFTVQVKNQGSEAVKNVLVTNVIADVFQLDSTTASSGTSSTEGNLVTLNLDSLASSQTVTIIVLAHVRPDAQAAANVGDTVCLEHDYSHRRCVSTSLRVIHLVTDR